MNFLQLCQRLRRKARASGTGPVAVTGQNEEYSRLIDWTNEAWMSIQRDCQDWAWMRTSASFTTVNGQATYTTAQIGLTDFGNWDRDTFRQYRTASGVNTEQCLPYIGYEYWRDSWQLGSPRNTPSQPIEMTITPVNAIGLGPVPLVGYTVTGDYYRVPSEMVLAADTPALPSQFHMLIVYRAMMFYGPSEAAREVYDEGLNEYIKLMGQLALNQLPEIETPDALV